MAREEGEPAAPRGRSWLEVRWRQARNPPPPVLRAVIANLAVALAGGVVLLGAEFLAANEIVALSNDLRTLLVAVYVVVVMVAGSALTWLWVELPTGASGVRRRSGWAALLGFFASLPIAYLSLVVIFQIVRPLLVP
jgi:cytochrome bd-type quinol oxidase subunit 2